MLEGMVGDGLVVMKAEERKGREEAGGMQEGEKDVYGKSDGRENKVNRMEERERI